MKEEVRERVPTGRVWDGEGGGGVVKENCGACLVAMGEKRDGATLVLGEERREGAEEKGRGGERRNDGNEYTTKQACQVSQLPQVWATIVLQL